MRILFFSATALLLLLCGTACMRTNKKISTKEWLFDIRQKFPPPPTLLCDSVAHKSVSFDVSHEKDIDTTHYLLVIYTDRKLYDGPFHSHVQIDNIPYCSGKFTTITCFLIDTADGHSYQFETEKEFNLFDPALHQLGLKLHAEPIGHSNSTIETAMNHGAWDH